MLTLPGSLRILVATTPVDFRKSHDGLAALVRQVLGEDPLSGSLFVFANKRADRLKLLYWDGDGLALWHKRLEVGTFRMPRPAGDEASQLEISAVDLAMILSGIDLADVRRRKRYRRPAAAERSSENPEISPGNTIL